MRPGIFGREIGVADRYIRGNKYSVFVSKIAICPALSNFISIADKGSHDNLLCDTSSVNSLLWHFMGIFKTILPCKF